MSKQETVSGSGIGADTMGHRGARAPHFWFSWARGAQITDMKRKWSSLEENKQFAHSIWKYEQHNLIS